MRSSILRLACALLTGAAVTAARGAMTFDNYQPAQHDRFDSASFIGTAYDWTGVARSSDGTWGTLLSSTWFISANHSHPGIGSTLTFFTGNSSTDSTVVRTVSGGQRVGNTDLWLGTLDTAVPAGITPYALASPSIANISTGLGTYANVAVFNVGLKDGATAGTLNFAVGQNRLDVGTVVNDVTYGTFDAVGFIQDLSGDANFIAQHETFLRGGDSGAPTFVFDGLGTLTLAGIHYATEANVNQAAFQAGYDFKTPEASIQGPNARSISVDTFAPNYASEIQAIIAVPEPALLSLLALGTLVFFWRVRRR